MSRKPNPSTSLLLGEPEWYSTRWEKRWRTLDRSIEEDDKRVDQELRAQVSDDRVKMLTQSSKCPRYSTEAYGYRLLLASSEANVADLILGYGLIQRDRTIRQAAV